jgi:hypothetical protein
MMEPSRHQDRQVETLIQAALLETACVLLGLILNFVTGHALWTVIGAVAGLGFSLPAVIRFIRESREQDHASR